MWSDMTKEALHLAARNIRIRVMRPSTLVPSIAISSFLFLAFGYAFGKIASVPGFPAQNYLAFLTPFIVLQAMVFSSGDAGFGMLTDILSGYFDKLLLAPINRFSILFATLFTASLRAIIQVVIIVAIALGMGVSFKTGALGVLVVIWFAVTFSVGWTCLGIIIALRTRSPEVTQSYFVVFFPAVFLTTAFVPAEFLPGWFRVLTRINPVTYILESTRVLVIGGWDWGGLWQGLVVVVIFAGMLMALTTWFFRRATA